MTLKDDQVCAIIDTCVFLGLGVSFSGNNTRVSFGCNPALLSLEEGLTFLNSLLESHEAEIRKRLQEIEKDLEKIRSLKKDQKEFL